MPTHRVLNVDEETELEQYLLMGLELVPLPPGLEDIDGRDPMLIALGISTMIDAVRSGAPVPDGLNIEDLATCLGVLFGEELCRVVGWSWAQLTLDDGFDGLVVSDEEHGLAMLPIHYVYGLLSSTDQDNTLGMMFQMICRQELPAVSPNSWKILG